MRTMQLGTTGVEVSAICLGTAYYGSSIDKSRSVEQLHRLNKV
jgi:aryl-alcohol dehydrogenase-like predicted oxidoreductase